MANTFYEGKLEPTGRWPEALESLRSPLANGQTPFNFLAEAIRGLSSGKSISEIDESGDLWISADGFWVRISPDGILEIGEPAA